MRTKNQIHVLTGHDNTVASILTNSVDPQVITGSHDNTIKVFEFYL
jgi:pleiotropic regulator 1